jgi:hypothetical protein
MIALEMAAFWMTGSWPGAQNGFGSRAVTGADIIAGNIALKAGGGTLKSVLVNGAANGANPILIYDNAVEPSGIVLAVVPGSVAAGTLLEFDNLGYSFGLTIKQTAAACDLTVTF